MLNGRLRPIFALLRGLRPKQAAKNLFVYAALIFANKLFDPTAFGRVTLAFLLFSVASGSVYLLNDILDVEQDRQHPKKRFRPIASGDLPLPIARIALVVLAAASCIAGWILKPLFGLTLVCYILMNVAYCIKLKHVVLLDVFTIAAGFVLRTVSGAFVISVHISHWLLLCTLQLALFLGFLKRRQELVEQGSNADKTRAILEEYSLPFLDQMINIVAGVSIVCYSVYTVESDTAHTHPHLWITVPIVIYGICRYLYLVYQKRMGAAPEEVLRTDRSMQVAIILWFLVVMALFKFDSVDRSWLGF
jgi:4-hydroxybenzoate polyprenyltransferase